MQIFFKILPPDHQRHSSQLASSGAMKSATPSHYACRRCGSSLFNADVVSHADGIGEAAGNAKAHWARAARRHSQHQACTSVFVCEAPDWADKTMDGNNGALKCPKCEVRVGNYAWSGGACSCGKWIAPAFQFPRAKIDGKMALEMRTLARTPPAGSAMGTTKGTQ